MRSRGRFFTASLKGLALVSLVAGGFQCVSAGRDEAAGDDGCDIDPLLRPVILIHGFRRTFLYNSSANYEIAGVDNEDVAPGSDGRGGSELDLPLTWDPENAIQDMTDVGPERFDGDDTPGLFLLNGTLVPLLNTVFPDLISIVRGWEASPGAKGKQLLYTVAYDWRRDLWEQSERVVAVVDEVLQQTGCKPIIAAHSFGGTTVYSAIARFGKPFAEKVHGVFYGAAPFQPFAVSLISFILGSSDVGRSGTPQSQFTFPSLFNIVPSAAGTCADGNPLLAPAPGQSPAPITGPMPCGPADLPTGLTCKSGACGRPADWPEGEPFFLNLDLHDPATWQAFGLGLPAARLLQGQTGAELLYSQEELVHLTFALGAGARVSEATIGTADGDLSVAAATAEAHPPTVVLSLHLTDVRVPGRGVRDLRTPSSFECVPADTFGQLGAPQCASLLPDVPVPSDGLLPSQSTTFKFPELFGPKLQTVNATAPPPSWLRLAAADPGLITSPHDAVFQGRASAPESFVDCGGFPARVDAAAGAYPALEALLCSLVHQGAADGPGGDAAGVYGQTGG